VFTGYWRKPDSTADAFTSDGWFVTGDQGLIDADGYVTIVGRSQDMIITGGLNVYPREIEQLIDAISGVAESAVVGVAHPDFGEGVVALVVTRPGVWLEEQTVIEALQDQIAAFKRPKRVLFVDQLPRNAMGKVQKDRLRDDLAGTFGEAP
jgi:malonyl-CoA/methylmalonyl-CoA synthetase